MKGRECVGNVCCYDDDTTEAEAEEYDEIVSIPTIAIILPSVHVDSSLSSLEVEEGLTVCCRVK